MILKTFTGLLIYIMFAGVLLIRENILTLTPLEVIYLPFSSLLEFNIYYIIVFIISMYISFKYVSLGDDE